MHNNEFTNLLSRYLDGELEQEECIELLNFLHESDENKQILAKDAIVQRLLKATQETPIESECVMHAISKSNHIYNKNNIKEQTNSKKKKPKLKKIKKNNEKHINNTRRQVWNNSPASHKGIPIIAVLTGITAVVIMIYAGWQIYGNYTFSSTKKPYSENIHPNNQSPEPDSHHQHKTESLPQKENSTKPDTKQNTDVDAEKKVLSFSDKNPIKEGDGSDEPGFVEPPTPLKKEKTTFLKAPTNPNPFGLSMRLTESRDPIDPPVLFTKLQMIGQSSHWNATPGDLKGLFSVLHSVLDIDYKYKTATLEEISADPDKNPILYFSGHYHFKFTPDERAKLRAFGLNGGTIFFNTGLGSTPFYKSAHRELAIIFPDAPLQPLSVDHPLFHSYYDLTKVEYHKGVRRANYMDTVPWIDGVSINCRTVAMVSRWGVAAGWEGRNDDDSKSYYASDALKLGINLTAYSLALRSWVRNGRSINKKFIGKNMKLGAGKMSLVQVIYDGEWKTRDSGLLVLLSTFNKKTNIPTKLGIRKLRLTDPDIFNAPILYITGHEDFYLTINESNKLKKYLDNGGFLLAEACCGRIGFDKAFRAEIERLYPQTPLKPIPKTSSIYSIPNSISLLTLTPALAAKIGKPMDRPLLEGIKINKHYVVVYSPFGMAGGWEMSQSPYALGYTDRASLMLGQNILMYAVTQ